LRAMASRKSSKPLEVWAQELKEFVTANNRFPAAVDKGTASDHERSLHYWLARIRENYHKKMIPEEHQVLLVEVPGMQERFDRWDGKEDPSKFPDPEEIAAESGLSAEVIAALPPDAPKGHESYKKVIFRETQGIAVFQYAGSDGRINFQTTVAACGSIYAAQRIARSCYLRFENNETKPEILEFRASCYSRLQELIGVSRPAKQKASTTAGATDAKAAKKRKTTADSAAKIPETSGDILMASPSPQASASEAQSEVTLQPSPLPESQVIGDAPEGHLAWEKVSFDESANMCFIRHQENGVRLRLEVSPKNVGDKETAMRIGRLCFVEFNEGRKNPKETLKYRNELYQLAKYGKPAVAAQDKLHKEEKKSKRAKRAPKDDQKRTPQPMPEQSGEGRFVGALRFEGRAAGKKNAWISGVYMILPGGFDGHLAYQRWSGEDQPEGQPLLMFYASEKKRWKVSNTLGDTKGGFAYLKTRDGTKPPSELPSGARWMVFEGKENGYVEDADLTCVPKNPTAPAEKAADPESIAAAVSSDARTDESAGNTAHAEPTASAPAGKTAVEDDGGSDDDDDASSSDSSSSASEDDQDDADADASTAEAGQDAAKLEEHKQAANGTATVPVTVVRRPAIRACAKMLVRVGLRCACHFTNVRNCPGGRGQLNGK